MHYSSWHTRAEVQSLHIRNLLELDALASAVIPRTGYDYIARGAGDEQTLEENRKAFQRVFVDQRVLTGKGVDDLKTEILGSKLRSPVIIAAMAAHAIAHLSAESGTARAAAHAGTLLGVSTVSSQSLEQIANASDGDKWFQFYITRDQGFNRELLQRARTAGYKAIILTADVTVGGNREQQSLAEFDRRVLLGNFFDSQNRLRNIDASFQNLLGPESIDIVREQSGLPVIVKGVTTGQDANRAIAHGAAAIQVSNHGGRQLDGAPAAFNSLPGVAKAVQGRVPIIFDSGVRRGLDVFKAVAAGADVVALGRPILYGLALGGWQGVVSVLDHLEAELRMVMQLAGTASIAEIKTTRLIQQ